MKSQIESEYYQITVFVKVSNYKTLTDAKERAIQLVYKKYDRLFAGIAKITSYHEMTFVREVTIEIEITGKVTY